MRPYTPTVRAWASVVDSAERRLRGRVARTTIGAPPSTARMPVSHELQPGDVVDGYRIIRLLGRGGMGVVFEAEQLRLGRRVAFKVLAEARAHDPSFRERFAREAQLAARLDHPHVVTVYDAGVAHGQPWIAMALVDGEDLGSRLQRDGGRLDPAVAADVIGQIAAALDHAHARGVLHRDVKPANIFLADIGGAITALLGDFGLTKETDASEQITATGMVVGSVDYLAPELIDQRPVDHRADLYALAATLLMALTGSAPFSGSRTVRLASHASAPRPLPSGRHADLVPFDPVVVRGMAVDPANRYDRGADLAAAARSAAAAMRGPSRATARATVPADMPWPDTGSMTVVADASEASGEFAAGDGRSTTWVQRPVAEPAAAPAAPRAAGDDFDVVLRNRSTPSAPVAPGVPMPLGGAVERSAGARRQPRRGRRVAVGVAVLASVLAAAAAVIVLPDDAARGGDFPPGAAAARYGTPDGRWFAVMPAAQAGWSAPRAASVADPTLVRTAQAGPAGRGIVVDDVRGRRVGRPVGEADGVRAQQHPDGLRGWRYRVRRGGPAALRCGSGPRVPRCFAVRLATDGRRGVTVVAAAPSVAEATATASRVAQSLRLR